MSGEINNQFFHHQFIIIIRSARSPLRRPPPLVGCDPNRHALAKGGRPERPGLLFLEQRIALAGRRAAVLNFSRCSASYSSVKDANSAKIALFKVPKTLARQTTERTRARTHKPRPPIGYSGRALSGVTKEIPGRIKKKTACRRSRRNHGILRNLALRPSLLLFTLHVPSIILVTSLEMK